MASIGTPRRYSGSGRFGGSGRTTVLSSEQAVYDYAVRSLARHSQTVAQLRRSLSRRVEPGEAGEALIAAALARLLDHGYLSDERYAKDYASARANQAHLGKRRIASELLQKGISPELAQEQVSAAFAETDDLAQAQAFLAKKRVRPPADQRQAARIFRMLARAGFAADVSMKALRGLRASRELSGDSAGPGGDLDSPDVSPDVD